VWIINGSLSCDVTTDSACFGENMLTLLALTTNPAAGGLGALLIIILGLIAILAAAFQIVLMVARGGMLVILAGILPLSASFTNTEMGKSWFKKCIAWLVAFILYKPAAAIVYAAAFQLVGTDVFSDDGTGLLAVLTGLMLMVHRTVRDAGADAVRHADGRCDGGRRRRRPRCRCAGRSAERRGRDRTPRLRQRLGVLQLRGTVSTVRLGRRGRLSGLARSLRRR
jgi:uncharacterized membrane protein HdeD (DUF308 family)